MSRRWRNVWLTGIAVAALAACGPSIRNGGSSGAAGDGTALEVYNNKWQDVVVYAVRNGRSERLGMVTSVTARRFALPPWATFGAGDLQLLIDPIGSRGTYRTGPIAITAGDRVSLRVENHLPLTSFFVQRR